MKDSTFLSNSDRHDLFEKIKKIDRDNEIWNNTVTISFIGPDSVEKSKMMSRVLQQGFYNRILIDSNYSGYYMRYTKIPDEKEATYYVVCVKCGGDCVELADAHCMVCRTCDTKMSIRYGAVNI